MKKIIIYLIIALLVITTVTAFTLRVTVDGKSFESDMDDKVYTDLIAELNSGNKELGDDMLSNYIKDKEEEYRTELKNRIETKFFEIFYANDIDKLESLELALDGLK